MLTEHTYQNLPENWDSKIKECCDKENPDDPRGCDCCYDDWVEELKDVKVKYSAAEEKVNQLKKELSLITDRRDKLKKWYDELTIANELARKICHDLEVLLCQAGKVGTNTYLTVKAIRKLYCMVRDFYMQIDKIKTIFDKLMNCIKCLNNPALAPGQGIMKCLEEYGKKLDVVIATRNDLIKMLMEAIRIACRINKNIEPEFGLSTVITEWKDAFHCEIECDTTGGSSGGSGNQGQTAKYQSKEASQQPQQQQQQQTQEEASCLGNCDLIPIFSFPICKDPYYACVNDQYNKDKTKAEELAKEVLEESKKKESLLACKTSLEAAIKEVDPKVICKA
jgi:hypothetical protein